MISLARATLLYEWRRFLPATLAVAFAGLLVLVSLALLLGMFATVAVYIEKSGADLWVGYRDTPSVDLGRGIGTRNEVFLRMHPQVERVEPYLWTVADWRRPDGQAVSGFVIGVDTRPAGLTFSRLLTPAQRAALDEPDTVIIDVADLRKLGVQVGERAELNRHSVKVIDAVRGIRAIGGANILASLATARYVDPDLKAHDGYAEYLLVKLRDPRGALAVRNELQPRGTYRPYTVWTAPEFSEQSQSYWLFESGAGTGVLFSAALGFLVGVVITSQTLMAAITSSLREYAALRALGVSIRSLRHIVLEQSFWIGLVGLCITAAGTAAVWAVAYANYVAFAAPLWAIITTAVLIMVIAGGSGLLALRALTRAEPATLLR